MFAFLVASASAITITPEIVRAFDNFRVKYGKSYSDEELSTRLEIFAQNLEMANKLNEEHILVGGTAVFGITKFMDITTEEFQRTYLTYRPLNGSRPVADLPKTDVAAVVDWRTKNVVTPVKDQGQCGSCWAFSATEAIESYAALSGKYSLLSLSAQQINSCDKTDGGCNGGNTETAYGYVKSAGGLELASDYPYTSGTTGKTGTCNFVASKVAVKITGYKAVPTGESNLQTALNAGPVSICLAATRFQTYTGGILKTCDNNVDHCVQGVGYDTGSDPYWLVRNSWGTSWGEKGYIRIATGKDLCKIADDVTYPLF
jgi:C1A family cysteine protease